MLQDNGLERGPDRAAGADGRVTIKLLYFIQLAKLTGRDEEEVEIPESVTNVETLLAWLGNRRQGWEKAFAADKVQVTVNRHFAELFTLVEHGDEVAIVPRAL
jgi:molybdopterin synthase sulfur carrier subunit